MRRLLILLVSSVFLISVLGVGCGAPVAVEPTPTTEVEPTPTTRVEPTPTTETKEEELEFVYAITNEPKTLSPNFQADTGGYHPNGNIYSALVAVDWGQFAYGDLAESWEMDAEGKVYTFHLRKNARWHDGEPVTSADVKYTYETIIEKKYPGRQFLAEVERLVTPDDYTVVIELSEPNVAFVPMLGQAANWYMKIMPKHIWEGTDWDAGPHIDNPIGSGPFRFVEWVKGSHIVMEANDDYFMGRPKMDTLIMRIIPDSNVAQAEFEAGNMPYLPYWYAPPFGELKQLMEDPDVEVVWTASPYSRDLIFNLNREPLTNSKVREAIAYAVNRDEINQRGFHGLWEPSRYVGVERLGEWINREAMFPEHDKAKAEQLLDEAGFPRQADGWRFKLSVTNPVYAPTKTIAEIVVEQLKDVGIDARWNQFDQATWWQKVNDGDFDISVYFTRYGPDPDAYREHFASDGPRNFMGYSNSEVDRLGGQARKMVDEDERRQAYGRMQELIVQDIPYVNLFNELKPNLVKPGWDGIPVQESAFGKTMGWYGMNVATPPE